ncbi:MAG: glycoside hydrolase family 57 protein [Candidatus Margulisiibacteriota bacterium]
MKPKNLYVAFVWHMHQPFYRDMINNTCSMPWVRLHATKDYYDMAAILDEHPKIKQTFNYVPSLLLQLQQYVENDASDTFLDMTRKPASSLTEEDKQFLLSNFFMANEQHMIDPYPRYRQLFRKRHDISKWHIQEFLDLQVWFNLTWFGYSYKNRDETIKDLIEKGKHFTEADKKKVIAKQWEVMGKVIEKHKELWHKKQIELTTTPFYHPILPLLCDTHAAKMALPHNPMPLHRMKKPEDAEWHIKEGLEYFQKLFGKKPKGMWPSEGSVSPQAAELIAKNGIEWIATDEEILKHSLGLDGRPTEWGLADYELFSPWKIEAGKGNTLNIIFRDHKLSDAIGFRYSGWNAKHAADDLVGALRDIHHNTPADKGPFLVNIILDGENAWECFPNNGWDFLTSLYTKLAVEPGISTTTVSEFLKHHPSENKLKSLYSGSWIDHNFFVWIGYERANKAWDFLSETRDVLKNTEDLLKRNKLKPDPDLQENIEKARQEIYIAEGSDWFWWYSDFHSSALDLEFDEQFRNHLQNVYRLLNLDVPEKLTEPLATLPTYVAWQPPVHFISPPLTGDPHSWEGAGVFTTSMETAGTMAQVSANIIHLIMIGQDHNYLYLRLDPDRRALAEKEFDYNFYLDGLHEVTVRSNGEQYHARLYRRDRSGKRIPLDNSLAYHVSDFIEIMVPLANLALNPDQESISITACAMQENNITEQWPANDRILFELSKG